jgi:hypothetical protein
MSTEPSPTATPVQGAKPIPRWLAISRKRAFLTHLLCSTVVVGIVCLVVFFVWYPGPYLEIAGAWRPLRILVGVDLVLGPLLTLLLFKPGKKGLLFDLAFILVIQLAAFAYGMTAIYSNRPYFDVFAVDRFVVLSRSDIESADWARASERVGAKPLIGPIRAFAHLPTDADAPTKGARDSALGGRDIDQRPELWSPYKDRIARVIARIKPLSDLQTSRPDIQKRLAELPAKVGLPAERIGFLPVMAGTRATTLIVDTSTAEILDLLDKDPWETD